MKKQNKFFLLYIIITKNNLKISITDISGKMIFKKTEGMLKGIRKGSINSADTSLLMMNSLHTDIQDLGLNNLGIYLKGVTRWKKLSLRRLFSKFKATGVAVKFIRDITGTPHNGCSFSSKKRKRKRRRLKRKLFLKEYCRDKKNNFESIFSMKINKKTQKRVKKGMKFLKYIKKLPRKKLKL